MKQPSLDAYTRSRMWALKPKNTKKRSLEPYGRVTPYIYLAPAMIILLTFMVWPLIQALIYSFQDYNVFTGGSWIGLENYRRLLDDSAFRRAFGNSVSYFVGVVPALVVLPIFIASLINQKVKGVGVFRAMYFFPVVTSMVVAGITWRWVYAEQGILNYLMIVLVPWIDSPIGWLSSARTALPAVMTVTIWKGLGYYMIIYLAGLKAIPEELYDVAKIDGTPAWRRMFNITMPLLIPYMTVVAVMSSIASMKVFDEVYVMTGGGPYGSSRTLVFEIYTQAFERLDMGYGSAIGFMLFAVLIVLSALSIWLSDKAYDA